MHQPSRREFLRNATLGSIAWWAGRAIAAESPWDNAALERAAASAKIADDTSSKVQRWLHEKALP